MNLQKFELSASLDELARKHPRGKGMDARTIETVTKAVRHLGVMNISPEARDMYWHGCTSGPPVLIDPAASASMDNNFDNSQAVGGGQVKQRDYRSMFYGGASGKTLDRGNFENASEFLTVLESGRYDPRLTRASMVEGVGSGGGYSVPPDFASQWLDASLPNEIVRNLCQIWPMESATRKVPGWDDVDQSSGNMFGGFAMEFLAEEGTGSKQTGKMRLVELTARKGAIFVDVSSELEQDGMDFESQLKNALIKSIGYGIDKFCINGTGAGQPQGVFSSSALIEVAKESGQAAGSIVYKNLTKMYSRQLNKENAVWLFNSDAIPGLLGLSIAVGTGGSHYPVLKESNGKFSIFGRPAYFTPHMPTVGAAKDCGFIDFSAYALGIRKEMQIDKSNAPGWTQDLVSYRILMRFDGQGVLCAPITPENGETLSPFVTLAERG